MPGIFITGTDTEVGKTHVACAILNLLNKHNLKTVGMKPVASGAEQINERWQNEDALKLMQASSVKLSYELINPYLFKKPASPHIAAQLEQRQVELETIISSYLYLEQQADFVVVEGVGGWLAPLNNTQTVADLAQALELPVVLIVGMRLGCLNHALLTVQSIRQSGLELAGWIANCPDKNFTYLEENIKTLNDRIDAPLLARISSGDNAFETKYEKRISLLAKAN